MPTLCLADGCNKHPSYGLVWGKPTHCATHGKKEGMENVVGKRCSAEGCNTTPSYGLPGGKRTHCSGCKLDGMENVVAKRCLTLGCTKQANHGLIWGKPTHCGVCKTESMQNVVVKRCLTLGCNTTPSYGLVWKKPTHCATHGKLEGMKDVKNIRCLTEGCNNQPSYGIPGGKRTHCGVCKTESMQNNNHKACLTPYCETYPSNTAYDGYCLRCFMYTFPDRKVARNYKTKEQAVVDHVQEHFPEFTWIADKRISDGCSLRRPDLLVDIGSHVVVVEVDEDQHQGYDCSCEHKRLMELSKDVGHRPLVFIRFNPDKYVDERDARVDSCWKRGKDGIIKLTNSDRIEWDQRLAVLSSQIEYWMNNQTQKTVEVIELFYDGWNTED